MELRSTSSSGSSFSRSFLIERFTFSPAVVYNIEGINVSLSFIVIKKPSVKGKICIFYYYYTLRKGDFLMSNVKWTKMMVEFVRRNAAKLTDKEGAKQLSVICSRAITTYAWRKQRQLLGLAKRPGRGVSRLIVEDN
jgi:hypothetical protein